MEESIDILVCVCSSTEHQIVIKYDEEEKEAYCHIHLTPLHSFWKRLVYGIKYIFGYKCCYGAFDEIILDERHSDKILKLGNFLKNSHEFKD